MPGMTSGCQRQKQSRDRESLNGPLARAQAAFELGVSAPQGLWAGLRSLGFPLRTPGTSGGYSLGVGKRELGRLRRLALAKSMPHPLVYARHTKNSFYIFKLWNKIRKKSHVL